MKTFLCKRKGGEESEKDKTLWLLAAARLATIIFWQPPRISPAWWWQPISGMSTGTNAAYDYINFYFFDRDWKHTVNTTWQKHYQGQIGLSLSNPAGQDMCSLYISFLFTSSIMEGFSVKRRSRGTVSRNSTKIGFRLVFSLAKVCKWTCLKGHEPSRKYKFWSLENQSLWAGRLECAPSCVIDGVKVNSLFLQWLFSPRITSVGGSALRRRCGKSWQAGEKKKLFHHPSSPLNSNWIPETPAVHIVAG